MNPDDYIKNIQQIQKDLLSKTFGLLRKFNQKNGILVKDEVNTNLLLENLNAIDNFLKKSGFYSLNGLYSSDLKELKNKAKNFDWDVHFTRLELNQLNARRNTLLESLNQVGVIKNEIYNSLDRAVFMEESEKDLMQKLQRMITGDQEVDGLLMRHAKTYAHDAFNEYQQGINNVAARNAAELGIKIVYHYAGNRIKTTRPFCDARVGYYYSEEVINKWESQDWAGKNKNGSIWYSVGGWNCRHQLIPESIDNVPAGRINIIRTKKGKIRIGKTKEELLNIKELKQQAEANIKEPSGATIDDNIKNAKDYIKKDKDDFIDKLQLDYESKKFTTKEIDATDLYIGDGYMPLNKYYRTGKLSKSGKMGLEDFEFKNVNTFTKKLDSFLDKCDTYQGYTNRTLGFKTQKKRDAFLKSVESKSLYMDKAYCSSSIIELDYFDENFNVKMYMKGKTGKWIGNSGEAEILYKRETKFKVLKVDKSDINNIEVYMEEL